MIALSSILLAGPSLAHAEEQPIGEAMHVGASQCLDAKALADHVAMWLKRRTIDRRIAIDVTDAPDGVRFTVRRDGELLGERTLEVKKIPCEEIHAATGLGIAVAIDATVLTSLGVAPEVSPPPVPNPPSLPSIPTAPPPPVIRPWVPPPTLSPGFGPPPTPKPAPPSKQPRFTATVLGVVLINLLPEVTVGVAPVAELTVVRGFDLRASALVTASTRAPVGGGFADVGLIGGRFDACAAIVLLNDLARLRGCGGLIAGAVRAQGVGFPDSRAATAPWIAPTVRGDARWSLTRVFGMVVGVDGFFPGLKPELQVIDDKTQKVTSRSQFPLAGVAVSLGPSVTF